MRLIGGLLIAGIVLVFVLVDFARRPWLTPYVELLAFKIGLVVVVLGIASYNKFRLTPRLTAGDPAAVAELRKMIDVELVVIAAVLMTTAILTTYLSPQE